MREFKVGDRVSFVDQINGGEILNGTVIEFGASKNEQLSGYFVKVDNGLALNYDNKYFPDQGVWWFSEDKLTLVVTKLEPKTQVYNDILGYKVVVIPHLKQVRIFRKSDPNKAETVVTLSDEQIPFDPVYGFLMAYAKEKSRSNTLLQGELEKLRHDPVLEPKVKTKPLSNPIVWISSAGEKIHYSEIKSLTTRYLVNIVKLIVRQGLATHKDFDIEATVYLLNEAHSRGELKDLSVREFRSALLPL